MKTVHFLEDDDIIHPDDWCRPLTKSSDYESHSDQWNETNTYGGSPLDHLKWCPVWLCLGKIWWGSEYGKLTINNKFPHEYIRGDIPNSHKQSLKWNDWHKRHPLWWESYLKHQEIVSDTLFTHGKYKDCNVGKVYRMDSQYIDWYSNNVNNELSEKLRIITEGSTKSIWYNPEYRTKFNGNTEPVLSYN